MVIKTYESRSRWRGKVGYAIVLQLSMENHDITAIDCSADALTYIQNAADVLT